MATKFLSRIAALAAMLLTAAACIYPYEVDLTQDGELPLVIEGDIHAGGITNVKLSHVRPFGAEQDSATPVFATGYIESEDGTRIEGDGISLLTFDTQTLREDGRYRLHLETIGANGQTANVFESDWLTPMPAPTIDNLSYSNHPDYNELWIGLSMHCNGSHYFRWSFSEAWEYHSDISTTLEYKPQLRQIGHYEGPSLFYCWNEYDSPQINIFSTVNQTEDRFEELAFHRIPLNNKRLQMLYRITVRLEALSEDAYNYWYNMQQNTEGQGSIFSPTPSEMASNVHCISNPDVQVVGYLNASVQTEAVMYYDNSLNMFYKADRRFETQEENVPVDPAKMEAKYRSGFLPFAAIYEMSIEPTAYTWALDVCIDCRKQGGTKNRPKDWPSNNY